MTNPNLEMLRRAVENLDELAGELVFFGGCTTGLLITDPGAAEIRTTKDVDRFYKYLLQTGNGKNGKGRTYP